jgi:hypothetical protein
MTTPNYPGAPRGPTPNYPGGPKPPAPTPPQVEPPQVGPPQAPVGSLRLGAIALTRIDKGGYTITCTGAPAGSGNVYLCVGNGTNRLDITGGYKPDMLAGLLACVGAAGTWGTTVKCWAVLEQNGLIAGQSAAQTMTCPVQPYDGPLTFEGIAAANPPLTYPGNGKGRLWINLGGKYYFRNGSTLETDNAMRGFDCTTFPMALFETYPNMSGKYGTALADALGAEQCDMEMKTAAEIKPFFADYAKGPTIYFMWSEGHVVLEKLNTIHEFTYGGYKCTSAQDWPGYGRAARGQWWVRKLPATRRA